MNPPTVNKWLVTVSVMTPTLIEILDTSVANVSLTHIQGSLSAGQEEVTWVLTSYLVANAVVIPMSGWLARLMGRKVYLLISLLVFTIASILCGTATSLGLLVLYRIIQGIGGGGLQPMCQAILLEAFPANQRGLAMGIFGMGVVVGPILGPLLGGYLTDNYSWRWIFYINLPIGIMAFFMIINFIFDPPYHERRVAGEKIDYLGLILLCVGLASLQIVLDKGQMEDWFNSNFIRVLSVISIFSLVLLVFWELGHDQPIMNLRVFKDRSFATGNIVMFLAFFAFFGSIVLLPLFLQTLLGYTAYLSGWVLGPGGAIALLALPIIGKMTEKVDARILLGVGLLVSAYSVYYMAGFNLQVDFYSTVMSRILQGIGMPFIFVSCSFLAMAYVRRVEMNNASAIFNLLRNLGGSFGVAFVTTLVARRTQFHQHRLVENLTPFDPGYMFRLQDLQAYLNSVYGSFSESTNLAQGVVYQSLQRQAAAMAFIDAFYAEAIIFLMLIALLWIIKKPPMGQRVEISAH
jgi:MFS transporter, DHA2 family, multidrug resistance protein